jgi:DNA uptake protein ComE-like DNA-binding protein
MAMQLSWIGVSAAAMIAVPASTAPTTTPMAADAHASVPAAAPLPRRGPAVVEHYVDLNSASSKELMTLPGIGAAEASRIIANRPYLTKTELVSKNVLPLGPFLSLKRFVVAMPATVPKGKS